MIQDAIGQALRPGYKVAFAGQEYGKPTINFGVVSELGEDKVCVERTMRLGHPNGKQDGQRRKVWVERWKVARLAADVIFPWENDFTWEGS
ncbi:hypothetical protein ACIBCT_35210 [Streptosporangium sp. NPDC050855]|uniref:hypothetical protein n=1 Tax=Streptosporangium sp. NPDC050855 TaxID=3366194 RepID=UPI00379E4233